MAGLMISWFFTGEEYHALKEEFKERRNKEKDLKFAGFAAMAWFDNDQRVELYADREEVDGKEVTKSVTIKWRGREETELLGWMKEKWSAYIMDGEVDPMLRARRKKLRELVTFDNVTEMKVRHMEERGAPKSYVGYYKKDRALLRSVVQAEYNVMIGLYDDRDLEIVKKKVGRKLKGRGPMRVL